MNVAQIMSRLVHTCRPDDTLAVAVGKMWDHDVGCVPVVDSEGRVIGMLTDRDAVMGAYTQGRPLDQLPVSVAMARKVFSCQPADALIAAEESMRRWQIRRLPVVDAGGTLVGILSLNDIAREADREVGRKGREVSAQEVTATLAAVCEPHGKGALAVVA